MILCGGNIDVLALAGLTQRAMQRADRYLTFYTACDDHPGGLAQLIELVAAERGNIITVNHNRLSSNIPLGMTAVELLLEVRDRAHRDAIVATLVQQGYPIEIIE